jgi:hypothetical protein
MGRVRVVGGRKLRDSFTNGLLLNGSETDAMGWIVFGGCGVCRKNAAKLIVVLVLAIVD